jgi:hypothetical protein
MTVTAEHATVPVVVIVEDLLRHSGFHGTVIDYSSACRCRRGAGHSYKAETDSGDGRNDGNTHPLSPFFDSRLG